MTSLDAEGGWVEHVICLLLVESIDRVKFETLNVLTFVWI